MFKQMNNIIKSKNAIFVDTAGPCVWCDEQDTCNDNNCIFCDDSNALDIWN